MKFYTELQYKIDGHRLKWVFLCMHVISISLINISKQGLEEPELECMPPTELRALSPLPSITRETLNLFLTSMN